MDDPLVPINPEKLAAAQQRAGLPWRELAERAGTHHSRLVTIANARHGHGSRRQKRHRVPRSVRLRLARLLGVTPLYLEHPAEMPARAQLAQADYLDAVSKALERDTGVAAEVRSADNRDGLFVVATHDPLLEQILPEAWAEDWDLFRQLMNPQAWERFFTDGPPATRTDQEFEEAVIATIAALRAWLRPWLEGQAPLRREAIAAIAQLLERPPLPAQPKKRKRLR